jgi:ABC-2 type transport system ATP-binding protein
MSAAAELAVRTEGLTKSFGSFTALDHLDLAVPPGTVFGFLGPNGAGKTTTIRLLMGLLHPTAGSASILGHDVTSERDLVHRSVGYLPGDFAAYPDMTSGSYLTYLAELHGRGAREIAPLADRLRLALDRPVGALSHGNRQKVGIVQAFMGSPPVLVLDEPTSGLDPLMQREFQSLVREARAEGRTVFLSSHVLAEVEAVADTIGMVRDGRLLVVQSIEELKARARRRLDLTLVEVPSLDRLRTVAGVRDVEVVGRTVHLVVDGSTEEVFRVLARFGISKVVAHEVDLEDVFLDYYDDVAA